MSFDPVKIVVASELKQFEFNGIEITEFTCKIIKKENRGETVSINMNFSIMMNCPTDRETDGRELCLKDRVKVKWICNRWMQDGTSDRRHQLYQLRRTYVAEYCVHGSMLCFIRKNITINTSYAQPFVPMSFVAKWNIFKTPITAINFV
ncbi:hypothetical protein TNCV_4767601 [Trichonephila clavipes]|nr:hypothetical protein TNCV_4767601 [Trichonephila clavipes]